MDRDSFPDVGRGPDFVGIGGNGGKIMLVLALWGAVPWEGHLLE